MCKVQVLPDDIPVCIFCTQCILDDDFLEKVISNSKNISKNKKKSFRLESREYVDCCLSANAVRREERAKFVSTHTQVSSLKNSYYEKKKHKHHDY